MICPPDRAEDLTEEFRDGPQRPLGVQANGDKSDSVGHRLPERFSQVNTSLISARMTDDDSGSKRDFHFALSARL